MPYLFTCPSCQTKTLVDDQYSGHIGRCVTCDKPIEIPHFLAAIPSTAQGVAERQGSLSPLTRRLIAAVLSAIGLAGLAGLAYRYGAPALHSLSTGRERALAMKNLEQIASALNAYAADHGVYPTPVVRDATGRPMHSWRVAILPYLNEQQVYSQYDYGKPWDAPENLSIVDLMPSVYASPSRVGSTYYQCHYQLVTGDGTLFPPSGPLGPKQVLDDPAKTILVVEGLASNTPGSWTQPNELDIRAMTAVIGSNPGTEVGSVTEGGAAIVTVDGVGHFLEETTAPEVVRALLTASGGEPLADDVLD